MVTPLMRLALAHVDALPPPERADIYEGLAVLLTPLDAKAALQAQAACDAIRTAESQQLSFQRLFTSDPTP